MNHKHLEKLDEIVLAVDPQTLRLRAFGPVGETPRILDKAPEKLYGALEGVSKNYTFRELRTATHAAFGDFPVRKYTLSGIYRRQNDRQGGLWQSG